MKSVDCLKLKLHSLALTHLFLYISKNYIWIKGLAIHPNTGTIVDFFVYCVEFQNKNWKCFIKFSVPARTDSLSNTSVSGM